jgi:oligopeptide transport system substrate-binding protein
LEVRLVDPVAFFPYITSLPVSFALPRAAVERYGDAWWQSGKIISNGAFRLVEFDLQHGGLVERADDYPGFISGNIGRIEWTVTPDREERMQDYLENRCDFTMIPLSQISDAIPKQEIILSPELAVVYLVLTPLAKPMDNLSVRKALAHTLDRQGLYEKCRLPVALGGLVPPGMPGHSPEIGLPYDPELGRRLLAEAGYPAGRGFPKLTIMGPIVVAEYIAELKRSWRENLGLEFNFIQKEPGGLDDWEQVRTARPMMINGWIADYPDPDNFLRQSDIITRLNYLGWQDADYDRLVQEAARTSNRAKRMAMYRQADRWLVQDQALVLPILYGSKQAVNLVKPWVKSRDPKLFGRVLLKDFIIDEH